MKENTRLWGKRAMAVMLSAAMVGSTVPATAIAEDLPLTSDPTTVQLTEKGLTTDPQPNSDPEPTDQIQPTDQTAIQVFGLKVGDKTYDGTNTATVDQSSLKVYSVSTTGDKKELGPEDVQNLNLTITATFADATENPQPGERGKDVGENKRVIFDVKIGNQDYKLDTNGSQLTTTATITAKEISVNWDGDTFTYAGSAIGPNASIPAGAKAVDTDDLDVEVTGYEINAREEPYTATATLTGDDSGNYTITNSTRNYTIGPKSIANQDETTVTIDGSYYWSGEQIKPDASNVSVTVGQMTLTDQDFEVTEYGNNTNAGNGTVTVTGKGNFKDSATGTFTIQKATNAIHVPEAFSIEYNGTQPLLNDEHQVTADHGTVQYSLDGNNWSSEIPQAKNASEQPYSVQCKVEGNDNYDGVAASEETTVKVTITPKNLTVKDVKVNNKPYDGDTTATLSDSTPELVGVVNGDVVTFNKDSLKAQFKDKNVGTDKPVDFTFVPDETRLNGQDADNYTVKDVPASGSADITAIRTYVTGITASNKDYDGNTTATLDTSKATFANLVKGDVLNLEGSEGTFDNADAGQQKKVAISLKLGGDDARNYELDTKLSQTETTASINPAPVTVTPVAKTDLKYTGEDQVLATATTDPSGAKLQWFVNSGAEPDNDTQWSDEAPKGTAAGTYVVWCKAKGSGNYKDSDPVSVTATIKAATLAVKADAKSKVKGEKDPALTYSVDGLKGSDKKEDVLTGTLSRAAGEDVGSYDIQQGSLKSQDANYEIGTFVSAKFDITPQKGVVSYGAHVQDKGDIAPVTQGMSGTTGESKRLEAINARLGGGTIEYRSHVQDHGWMGWVKDGAKSGTSGESKRIEAIQMKISGASADGNHVWYRVHSENYGTLGWAKDGAPAGTANMGLRAEAYEVQVLPEGKTPADYDASKPAFVANASGTAHVQDAGNVVAPSAGMLGSTGMSRRIEAMSLTVPTAITNVCPGGIEYNLHLKDIGWQGFKADGAMAGTTGQARRAEAVQIRLTGQLKDNYSVWYRVHSQDFGWLDWAKDGAYAGTAGYAKRAEAVEVVILPKGAVAPGSTANAYRSK